MYDQEMRMVIDYVARRPRIDFDGTAIPAYSEPEDVPSWWKSEAVGGEVNDV